jgi:Neuraminidase (sialidase)
MKKLLIPLSVVLVVILGAVLYFSSNVPQVNVIKTGTIHSENFNAWATVEKFDDKVAVVWSGDREHHTSVDGKIYFSIANEADLSFCTPKVIGELQGIDLRDAGICYIDGRLVVTTFYNVAMPAGSSQTWANTALIMHSDDFGETWSELRVMPIMTPQGPIVIDGVLTMIGIVPAFDARDLSPNENAGKILVYRSLDRGETWELQSEVMRPAFMDAFDLIEPSMTVLHNGDVIASIRFRNLNELKGYHADTFFFTRSKDKGSTWSELTYSGFNGTPPHILQHSSGKLVLVWGHRGAPEGIRTSISGDFGETWGKEKQIAKCSGWDSGYPNSVELADGSILTVYYDNGSIHYTQWKLG